MLKSYKNIVSLLGFVSCLALLQLMPETALAMQNSQTGYNGGFYIEDSAKPFSLRINGFAQPRFTAVAADGQEPFYTFDVGLARLAFSGTAFTKEFSYFLQAEASTFGNTNTLTMLDWWIQYRFSPELYVKMGRILAAYSRQFYSHPGEWLYNDLANTEYAFHVQRVVGLEIGGSVGSSFQWTAMAMNSARPLDGGNGQQNIGSKIGATARAELAILDSYGYIETLTKSIDKPQLSVGVGAAYNPVNSNSGFQNTAIGDETMGITADIGFRTGGLSLQGAYHTRSTTRDGQDGSITDNGYFAQAGFLLTPALELCARYATVEFEGRFTLENLSPFKKQDELSLGFNAYLAGHGAKLQADYALLSSTAFGASESTTTHRIRIQTQVLF